MALGRNDRTQLRQQLSAVEGPIKIDYFHQRKRRVVVPGRPERPTCELAIELYTELATLSDKLTLNVYELADEPEMAAKRDATDVPCAVVRGELNRPLRLYGLPNGHVFVALVRAMVLASTRSGQTSAQLKRALGKLRRPSRLRLFASPLDPVSGQAALMCWATVAALAQAADRCDHDRGVRAARAARWRRGAADHLRRRPIPDRRDRRPDRAGAVRRPGSVAAQPSAP